MVIDPSIQKPEISSFNHVCSLSSMGYTYLLPALSEEDSMNSELQNTYGIILMGSACSVHDDLDWQKNLQDILLKSIEKEIPILGICYGNQLLAHMFGGIVGYLWSQEKKKGTRIVALRKNELWVESKLGPLIYSHQEGVISCPHDF
jgi:GMP synthase-like glutamine amidotransferase